MKPLWSYSQTRGYQIYDLDMRPIDAITEYGEIMALRILPI